MAEQHIELALTEPEIYRVYHAATIAAGGVWKQLRHPIATRPFRQGNRCTGGTIEDAQRGNGFSTLFPARIAEHIDALNRQNPSLINEECEALSQ